MTAPLPDKKTIPPFQVPCAALSLVHRAHCGIRHLPKAPADTRGDETQVVSKPILCVRGPRGEPLRLPG